MWHAIVNGNSNLIAFLAKHKAPIDTDSSGNRTYPIAIALKTARSYAERLAGTTFEPAVIPFKLKAANYYYPVIKNLIMVGCSPDEAPAEDDRPIFTAIRNKYDHIFRILVESGAADRDFSVQVNVAQGYHRIMITVKTIREYCGAHDYDEGIKIIDEYWKNAAKKKTLVFTMHKNKNYYFSLLNRDIVGIVCDYIKPPKLVTSNETQQ